MDKYDDLFNQYVADLRQSKIAAENWWAELTAEEARRTSDIHLAEQSLRKRWPFGPTSHPWVIKVFRKYYLLCEQLNKDIGEHGLEALPFNENHWGLEEEYIEDKGYINPLVFTLEWLSDEDTEDLYEFMSFMVFIPIGINYDISGDYHV